MLLFLRLQFALLPMLWSLWKDDAGGDDDSDDGDATGTNGDTSDTPPAKTYTPEQFRRALAAQGKKQREEIEAALKADAEKQKLEDDGKLRELVDKERAEKRDLKAALDARESAERNRILRYEIRDAARDLSFADPDDAFHLIDRDEIAFDEDGEPSNVMALVKALAERKPHLIKSEINGRSGTPPGTRGSNLPNPNPAETFLKTRYGTPKSP